MKYNMRLMNLDSLKEKPSIILILTLYFVPLWWILGLSPVIYHFSALLYLYFLYRKENEIRLSAPALFLLFFIIVYSFSFSIHWFYYPMDRVLASLYNMSIWIMGIALVSGIYSDRNFDFRGITRASAFLIWFSLGFFFLDYLIYLNHTRFSFPTLLGLFLPRPNIHSSLVELFFRAKTHIVGRWPFDFLPRVSYFSPYANAFAGLVFLLWGAGLVHYRDRKFLYHVFNLVSFALIFLSMSRGSFFVGGILFVVYEMAVLPLQIALLFLAFLFLLLSFLPLSGVNPLEIFSRLARGSTEARLSVYREALRRASTSPLAGIGIKPWYIPGVPLGSHSTYVGLLLKTGIMGFASFLAYEISLVRSYLKGRKYFPLALGIFALFLWMFFEDIDAPALTAFVFFVLSGALVKLNFEGGSNEGDGT